MANYICKRNPHGVKVGQTWYAIFPINQPIDVIKITAVFGPDYIYATKKNGDEFRCSSKGIKKHFSLDNHDDLFGETQ